MPLTRGRLWASEELPTLEPCALGSHRLAKKQVAMPAGAVVKLGCAMGPKSNLGDLVDAGRISVVSAAEFTDNVVDSTHSRGKRDGRRKDFHCLI